MGMQPSIGISKTNVPTQAIIISKNKCITQAVSVFRYLTDKDIFETYYRQYLSKRLLSPNRMVSEESERIMISKLKSIYHC